MSTLPLHESTRAGGGDGGAGCGAGCGASAGLLAAGAPEPPPHDVDAAERPTVSVAARRTRFEKYRRAAIVDPLRRRLAISADEGLCDRCHEIPWQSRTPTPANEISSGLRVGTASGKSPNIWSC